MCVQKHIKRQNDLLFNLVICQNKHVIKSFKKGKKGDTERAMHVIPN